MVVMILSEFRCNLLWTSINGFVALLIKSRNDCGFGGGTRIASNLDEIRGGTDIGLNSIEIVESSIPGNNRGFMLELASNLESKCFLKQSSLVLMIQV
jgi:hypothetical protein